MWHWFLTVTGSNNTSGTWYGFWSGFGSDIGELVIIGGLIQLVRHHNCHVKGCLRWGRHQVEGTPYKVCRVHHPDMPSHNVSYADVVKAHKKAKK